MKKKEYSQQLSDEDKLYISFTKDKGKIRNFCVNYSSLINGRWKDIMRIDNCHGYPHKHTFHLRRREFKVILGEDSNKVFTEAKEYIIKNLVSIKNNYLNVRPRK